MGIMLVSIRNPQVTMGLQVLVIHDLDDLGYPHDFGDLSYVTTMNTHSACAYLHIIIV